MTREVCAERQAFMEDITNFTFIREDGRLVLEPFCVYLSHCFGFDEKLHLAPTPIAVYSLLLQLIYERLGADEAARKIQQQGILDWQPGMEGLFSNCLFNFLKANDIHCRAASLHKLLNEVSEHRAAAFDNPQPLLTQVDTWRKARNTAIHGFIQSTSQAFGPGGEDFQRASQATATTGLELCRAIVQWYEGECVNFVRHEFPLSHINPNAPARS